MTKHAMVRRSGRPALVAALAGGMLLGGVAPAAVAESAVTGPAVTGPAVAEPAAGAAGTLGPFGYGGVRLGMSVKQARATGRIVLKAKPGWTPCTGWDLKGRPSGRDKVGLYTSPRRGVAMIFALPGVRTPQGVRIGSTAAQLNRAYPRLRQTGAGYASVAVPGNPRASYRFLLSHGEVHQMVLTLNNQDCTN